MASPLDSFQIHPDIAKAWTLPSRLYTDASVLASEKEKIFARTLAGGWTRQPGRESRRLFHCRTYRRTAAAGARRSMASYAVFTTSAGTAPDLRRKAADRANCFAADITAGPTGSMARCISATEIEGVEGFRPGRLCAEAGARPRNGSISYS